MTKYFDLKLSTLNTNFPEGVKWQRELINNFIDDVEPDALSLQELRYRPTHTKYTTIQGIQPDGDPAGEAIMVKGSLYKRGAAYPAFQSRHGNAIQMRTLPVAVLDLPIRRRRNELFLLNEHRPPKYMQDTLIDEENDIHVRRLVGRSNAKLKVVNGDLNETKYSDPTGLNWPYRGIGIDLFCLNPAMNRRFLRLSTWDKMDRNDGHKGQTAVFRFKAK